MSSGMNRRVDRQTGTTSSNLLVSGFLACCLFSVVGLASDKALIEAAAPNLRISREPDNDVARQVLHARFEMRRRYANQLLVEGELPESDAARQLVNQAEQQFGSNPGQAIELTHQALQQMDAIARRNPTRQRLQTRYMALLDGLQNLEAAYQRNASRLSAEGTYPQAPLYDKTQLVDRLVEAEQFSRQGQMMQGIHALTQAENLMAQSIKRLLNHRSIGEGTTWAESETEQVALAQARKEQEKSEYQSRQEALNRFKEAHRRNYEHLLKEEGKLAVVSYDADLVTWLEDKAQELAQQQNYAEAARVLKRSVDLVAGPLQRMLDKHKYIVKLDISTPEKEYKYEQNQYLGYEELIPVAIRRMSPDKELLDQVNVIANKGRWMAAESEKKALAQDYPVAIRMLQDATAQIQAALRMLGVPVFKGPR